VARINYIELPARDLGAARRFYASVFGWALTDFGPSYAATTTGTVDLGLQGDMSEATATPLPVVLVELEEGVRIVANMLDAKPEDVAIGRAVTADFVEVEPGYVLPAFRLT